MVASGGGHPSTFVGVPGALTKQFRTGLTLGLVGKSTSKPNWSFLGPLRAS